MAAGWIHATIDLLAFGRPYFDAHKQKDADHKELGYWHREWGRNHQWYKAFGVEWDFENPFPKKLLELFEEPGLTPEETERDLQSFVSHDYIDKTCDKLSKKEEEWWRIEGFFYYCLSNPNILRDKFGVDVLKGKIHRVINGKEVWEDEPEIVREYKELKVYADKVFKNKSPKFHQFYQKYSEG
ncbi:MAG TPA: hypothetical protein ACFYD5_06585 [Candidatus Tripitaka sp. YC43]